MTSLLEKAGGLLRQVAALFGAGSDTGPVDSVAALENFVATRSAYVAQKTLYGYVKTRMGTRYVAMFDDKNIIASLNIAKLHVFAACLSDLTLYAVATALHGLPVGNDEREAMARVCYAAGLRANTGEAPEQFSAQDCIAEFDRRLAETDWNRAGQPDNFTRSPRALMQWAPDRRESEGVRRRDRRELGQVFLARYSRAVQQAAQRRCGRRRLGAARGVTENRAVARYLLK